MPHYSPELVQEIANKHALQGECELLPNGGMVNEAWSIGEHILRICRREEGREEAAREAAVVPKVVEAGIRAPRLVAAELDCSLAPMPYTIYERAKGVLLGYCDFEPSKLSETYREIGREIARLHRIPVDESLRSLLRSGDGLHPWKTLAKAVTRKKLSVDDGKEIADWLDFIEKRMGSPCAPSLIHADIHPWNVFVDPEKDELTAIIDWGDATFDDPAIEFASMPIECVPPMFEGFLEEGGTMDGGFLARTLRAGVGLALWEIRDLPVEDFLRQWWRMPPGGWQEMKALIEKLWPEMAG